MAQLRSPGVLVRVRFHFVLDDYCDEYEMKSMENRHLVNWIIAWIGWTNMWWKAGAPIRWWTRSNSAVPFILLSDSVDAGHFHCLLSVWNCDSDPCEWDPCFQVRLNLQVWFKLFEACLFEAHRILHSQKNSGYSMNQPYWLIFSPLHKRIAVNFSTLLRQIQLAISNHPAMERLSKRYRIDVSYPETRLAYSRLTRSIQPSISSLRNEVQAHLKDTMLSSLMVSDLTPHAYCIQWPNLTRHHSLLSYAPTPRHASERFILLHSKHIFFLPECF